MDKFHEVVVESKESDGFVLLSLNSPKEIAVPIAENNHIFDTKDYKHYGGDVYNVNTVFRALSKLASMDNYGANSTVNYFTLNFKGVAEFQDCFPVINVGMNDFMLIEITIPDITWLSEHNLLNFTPYFFSYTEQATHKSPATTTNIFASCDNTIPFFTDIAPGTVKRICCTASKTIAEAYAAQGFIISRIPLEYLHSCTYMHLIRVGILHNHNSCTLPADMCKASYFRYQPQYLAGIGALAARGASKPQQYFTSEMIREQFVRPLEPVSTGITRHLHQAYKQVLKSIEAYKQSHVAGDPYAPPELYKLQHTYNYLSHTADVKYAFQSFYDAVSVRPVVEMLGNNTGENYFISDDIDVTQYFVTDPNTQRECYLYILSVNQSIANCGLSSNIHVYDRANNSVVDAPGCCYETAPSLPPMCEATYPFATFQRSATGCGMANPPLVLTRLSVQSTFAANNIRTITVAERNAYNPRNFNYTHNEYIDSAVFWFGEKLAPVLREALEKCCVIREM